jgi:hypothetical protein
LNSAASISGWAFDDGAEGHAGQDVAFQVQVGRDLQQFQALRVQAEDRAFGHVQHGLAALEGLAAREGAVFHLRHELGRTLGAEAADEDQALGVLADVDEAARAGQARAELADVDIAFGVRLRQAQEGHVQAATIVEIELVGLVDDGLRVDRRAEVQPAGRNATHHAGLGGERDEVDDVLFGRHRRHALGHADAQVDHAVGAQFQRRAARDDLAVVHGHRLHVGRGHAQFAGRRPGCRAPGRSAGGIRASRPPPRSPPGCRGS